MQMGPASPATAMAIGAAGLMMCGRQSGALNSLWLSALRCSLSIWVVTAWLSMPLSFLIVTSERTRRRTIGLASPCIAAACAALLVLLLPITAVAHSLHTSTSISGFHTYQLAVSHELSVSREYNETD